MRSLRVGKNHKQPESQMESLQIADWTFLLHVASSLSMVGLIWFVQIVHYPLMGRVGRQEFCQYEIDHNRLTSRVVLPLMITELLSAVALLWFRPDAIGIIAVWIGLALVVSIWVVTFTVQVPQHASLVTCFDDAVHRRLVSGNWYRTIVWTIRGVIVLWMIGQLMKPPNL